MQNVVCPTTIVQKESRTAPKLKNALSAIPVMIPGSASGSTNSRLMASRPKKGIRRMANAAQEPSTRESAVAGSPGCTESPGAVRISGAFQVAVDQLNGRPGDRQ